MDSPVRALVVGASETAALLHLPVLARLRDQGRLALAEICDIRRDRAAAARRRFGFANESGDAIAAIRGGDIDVVYLFGSAQLHHDYGLAALESSKHLFVEKPIAPSYAKACALADAAHARGLIAVGGHNRRFYRSLAEIRARAGKAGWRFAEAVFHKPEYGVPVPFGARSWLSANGIHALDALVYMMGGLPDHLAAVIDETGATPSSFSAVMRWPDGAQGIFLCDNNAGSRREDYAFHGLGETYRASDTGLIIERDKTATRLDLPGLGDGFAAEHAAFLDAIDSGEAPPHGLAALAPSLFLAELIEDGFSGPVRLPSTPVKPRTPVVRSSARAILVINPSRLKDAIALGLSHHPLVALEDVQAASQPRPDIAAVILGPGPATLTAEILDRLPNLAVAGLVGLSFARHAPEELLARDIMLVNASAAYAEGVAEYALGLAILARRRAFVSDRVMRRGGWGTVPQRSGPGAVLLAAGRKARPVIAMLGVEPRLRRIARKVEPSPASTTPARDLRGATVGLIGWGANARAFATRLMAAGARVLVHSEHGSAQDIRQAGASKVSLGEVLACDIVSLHRGLTRATRHGIAAAELDRLRPGAILINIARGALIEPDALLARLKRGDVFACLDTFEEEPLAAAHPLRKLPNVFLTSHIAGGSPDMVAAGAAEVIGKIAARLDGRIVDAVSADRLATMT
jgi:phosphoglycerate dehydrogenase-like enzyme/predicted dehydrogenase